MAQLSSIIGSILRDIISAQHEANLYSLALSENYGKDGRAKDFQLPGVIISDMELELKYGIISSEENHEQFNIKYNKFRQFVSSICAEAARAVIKSAVTSVVNSDLEIDDEDKQFFVRLKRDKDLNNTFLSFLSRKMRRALTTNLYESVDHQSGEVLVDVVVKKLEDVVESKFLDDSDLESLFEGKDGKALKEQFESNIHKVLSSSVKKLSEGSNFKRVKQFPRLDVAVTSDELSKMDEDSIHLFKLKFSPTTCSITDLDDEDENEEFIMK